jgi:hypothetical protein
MESVRSWFVQWAVLLILATAFAACNSSDSESDADSDSVTSTELTETTTTLSVSSTSLETGESLTLTATVSPSEASGTITFLQGSNTLGTATLDNVTLNATSDLTEHRGVFLYQSMSGDADNSECGTGACFTMNGGTYNYTDTTNSSSDATENCAAFAVANQTAYIELTDVEVNNSCPTLLLSALNSNWNYNGGTTTFIANGESLDGNVIVDSVSTADISLTSSNNSASTLTGAINTDNTGSSVTLTLDAASQWVITGTSYLTSLTNSDSTNSNITCETSGCLVYVNGTELDID